MIQSQVLEKQQIDGSKDEAIPFNRSFYFQWHITDRCNLRCIHCYQDSYSNNSEMALDELISVADKITCALRRWNLKGDVGITGGEPFLRKSLFPLLAYLEDTEEISKINIMSNGTLINDEISQKLLDFSKLEGVQISLDGGFPETHDKVRGKGSFDKAIKGVRILRKYGIAVDIMFTLQRMNINDVSHLIDLATEEGAKSLTIERFIPCGSGQKIKNEILSKNEIKNVFEYISNRADSECEKENPLLIRKFRTLWVNINPERVRVNSTIPMQKENGACCSVGIDAITILPDATVLPCRRLPIPIGDLKHDSVFKIWYDSDILWNIRDKQNLKGKCYNCEFIPRCSGCRAMAYACTGDYLAEDPQCWK